MANFPYVSAVTRLKPFFAKIQDLGTPPSVTQKWLLAIGFTSTNDRRLQAVLKFLNFTDESGKPTPRWGAYRDKGRAKNVMATALREAYAEVFHTYPDAYQRSDSELRNFFSSRTGTAGDTAGKMVATFKLLCELADFSAVPVATTAGTAHQDAAPNGAGGDMANGAANGASGGMADAGLHTITRNVGTGVTLNINIQLTVPDTTDENVYDNFFAALKKHLLS